MKFYFIQIHRVYNDKTHRKALLSHGVLLSQSVLSDTSTRRLELSSRGQTPDNHRSSLKLSGAFRPLPSSCPHTHSHAHLNHIMFSPICWLCSWFESRFAVHEKMGSEAPFLAPSPQQSRFQSSSLAGHYSSALGSSSEGAGASSDLGDS